MSQQQRIEHLMSRSLDGGLTPAERGELDAALAADPELRAEMEGWRRMDALCGSAIRAEFGVEAAAEQRGRSAAARLRIVASNNGARAVGSGRARREVRRHHVTNAAWVALAGLAACVAWLVVSVAPHGSGSLAPSRIAHVVDDASDAAQPEGARLLDVASPGASSRGSRLEAVADLPQFSDRRVDRDVYGVWGEDGRLYFIEIDRTRSVRRPQQGGRARLASFQM